MLRKDGYGARFDSTISNELTKIIGFHFVDDNDLIHMSDDVNAELFELSEHMQDALDLWEYGLQLTGGVLVPSKSWLHPISFK